MSAGRSFGADASQARLRAVPERRPLRSPRSRAGRRQLRRRRLAGLVRFAVFLLLIFVAVWAGVGDAHAGPHGDEDEQEEHDEAKEAGEAAPAQLAPAGPAARPRCALGRHRRGARWADGRDAATGAPEMPCRAHAGTPRRWRGTMPLSSLPHSRQPTTTVPLQ